MDITAVGSSSQVQTTRQSELVVNQRKTSEDAAVQKSADLAKAVDQAGGVGRQIDQIA